MIKIENITVNNLDGAVRGMRNPMNSWSKSDSEYCNMEFECSKCEYDDNRCPCYSIGPNDIGLMQRLYQAGPEHAKYLRQIFVCMDITAPIYFNQEFDTYKIGVTRNSCSFQHKGVSKPFSIRDFSVDDTRMYDVLEPIKEKKENSLVYPYETDEYKMLSLGDRQYKVFRNGKIISLPYDVKHEKDNRTRHFDERTLKPSQNRGGYWMLNLGGKRFLRKSLVHRIVAEVWLPKPADNLEINHIDGNKGNNSVENLEWVTHSQNEQHAHDFGLKKYTQSLSWKYRCYKLCRKIDFFAEMEIRKMYNNGAKQTEIAQKFDISQGQVWAICNGVYDDDLHLLFSMCEVWEKVISELNRLRDLYIETGDYNYFRAIRQLLPMGYNQKYTITMSYANVMNIINQRSTHKLDEWRQFCDELRALPYIKAIRGEE